MQLYKDLYEIVATFDKSEKRQFKLRIAGQTKTAVEYERMFDYLASLSAWHEEEVAAFMRKKWGARLPTLARGLQEWLFRTLEDMHNETPYQQCWHILLQIDALFERKLYAQAWRHIAVLDERATYFDMPIMRLFAYNWQLSFLRGSLYNFKGLNTVVDLATFLERGEEIMAALTEVQNSEKTVFKLLYYYQRLPKGKEQTALIEALRDDFLAKAKDNVLSRAVQLNYFYVDIFYHLNKNQYLRVLEAALAQWNFIFSLPDALNLYATSIYGNWVNIIMSAAYAERWDILQDYHQKLVDMLPDLPKTRPFEQLLIEPSRYAFLLFYYKTGQTATLAEHSALCLNWLNDASAEVQPQPLRRVQISYILALIAYEQGDFAKAELLLAPLLVREADKANFALQVLIRFLNLLLVWAQGQRRRFFSVGRQLYRWRKSHSEFTIIERRWLAFLRHEAKASPLEIRQKKLDSLRAALSQKEISQHERELLFFFPFARWIKILRQNY
jgi:hypothetical protein